MSKTIKKCFLIIGFIIMMLFILTVRTSAFTIVLDAGHGGDDPGSSKGELIEKDINLKIARYLKEYLENYKDVQVFLTHYGKKMSIEDRADFARNCNADLLLSLHINSSRDTSKSGAEVYVTYRTDLEKYNKQTTELGKEILKNLSNIGIKSNGVLTKIADNSNNDLEYKYFDNKNGDYYGIIRRAMKGGQTKDLGDDFSDGSGVPTILIEHAYLSNAKDRKFLDSDSKLVNLAKADCEAIVNYYKLNEDKPIDITKYLFNSKYYADLNLDLKNVFGYDENLLYTHYKDFGIKEGRQASPVFDPRYYLNKYSDLKNVFGNNYNLAYEHFKNIGIKEGRVGSKYFDVKYYLNEYSDLKTVFGRNYTKALEHFVVFGINEKRIGSSEGDFISEEKVDIKDFMFDANTYYNLYPDLQIAFGNNYEMLKKHYYEFGIKEGRQASPVFDPRFYLDNYSDLKSSFGENYELAYNHFICFGVYEGRKGSSDFDSKIYLNNYSDLKSLYRENYGKALIHYAIFGIKEGRKGI